MALSVKAPHRAVELRNNMAVLRNRHRTDLMKRNQLLIGLFCATSGSEGMSFASSRSIAVASPFIKGNLFIYYVILYYVTINDRLLLKGRWSVLTV